MALIYLQESLTVLLLCLFCLGDPIADQVKALTHYFKLAMGHTNNDNDVNKTTNSETTASSHLRNYIFSVMDDGVMRFVLTFFTSVMGFFFGVMAMFSVLGLNVVYCSVIHKLGTGWRDFLQRVGQEGEELCWEKVNMYVSSCLQDL